MFEKLLKPEKRTTAARPQPTVSINPLPEGVDPELNRVAHQLLAELILCFPLKQTPRLEWRSYRVTAGMAYYRQGVIGLSYRVLADEASVRSTLTHEFAHMLAVDRYGNRAAGHGSAWREAMRDLGQEPTVHHRYEVERNQKHQRVTYSCLRCGKQLVRSRRLPRKRRYVHANCGGDLRLSKVERVTPSTSAA